MLSEIIYLDEKSHKNDEVDGEDDMNDKSFGTFVSSLARASTQQLQHKLRIYKSGPI